ncbi:MAG: hypothetical protein K0S61_4311 [Anaerocolumna sp.]|nr:hypothetical protein [Anaerocolumna sp.]
MIYRLDISQNLFDFVDFSESEIFFDCKYELDDTVRFNVWGATLLTSERWNCLFDRQQLPFNLPTSDDIYLSGMCTVTLNNVVGGRFQVSLYDEGGKEFRELEDRKIIRLSRDWDLKSEEDIFEYDWSCVLNWPKGYCELSLACKGNIMVEFDESYCIPASEFILNTRKYSYK